MKHAAWFWPACLFVTALTFANGVSAETAPFSWAGWYLTGSAGYGWRAKNTYPLNSYYESLGADFSAGGGYGGTSGTGTPRFKGPAAAIGAGYNYQTRNFVVGAEYEFLYANLQTDPTHSKTSFTSGGPQIGTGYVVSNYDSVNGDSNRWYGIARLRGGLTVLDRTWVYLSAGAAYRLHYSSEDPKVVTIPYLTPTSSTTYVGFNKTHAWGLVLGAGIEQALWDNFFIRAEWLHMDFGHDTYLDPVATALRGTPTLLNFRRRADIARIGLTYRFYSGGY